MFRSGYGCAATPSTRVAGLTLQPPKALPHGAGVHETIKQRRKKAGRLKLRKSASTSPMIRPKLLRQGDLGQSWKLDFTLPTANEFDRAASMLLTIRCLWSTVSVAGRSSSIGCRRSRNRSAQTANGGSNKCGGIATDTLITAVVRIFDHDEVIALPTRSIYGVTCRPLGAFPGIRGTIARRDRNRAPASALSGCRLRSAQGDGDETFVEHSHDDRADGRCWPAGHRQGTEPAHLIRSGRRGNALDECALPRD